MKSNLKYKEKYYDKIMKNIKYQRGYMNKNNLNIIELVLDVIKIIPVLFFHGWRLIGGRSNNMKNESAKAIRAWMVLKGG